MLRTVIALFLFGAILGNGYNSLHAFMGAIPVTAIHTNPLLDWTSYLLFGFAGVSIGMLTLLFDRHLRKDSPEVLWQHALSSMLVLGVFYFLSACTFLTNTAILLIEIIGFVFCVWVYDRHGYAVIAAIIVAIIGTSAEVLQVHYQSYYYARPEVMGVTYWLPFLYAISSITTGQLARALASSQNQVMSPS